jgi:hypothetical protein
VRFRAAHWVALCGLCLAPGLGWAKDTYSFWENGDFIHPAPSPGTFLMMQTGGRYGAWRVVGASGAAAWTNGSYQHNGLQFLAQGNGNTPTTNSWVNLAAISQTGTGIAHRPVPTTVGANYTLSFYVGNIYDPSGVYGTSSTVSVYENSTLLGTYTNGDGQGTTVENWKNFSVTFAADAPWTVIAFVNGDPPGDRNCGIDNIIFAPTGRARGRTK